jgi:hypothetical protein
MICFHRRAHFSHTEHSQWSQCHIIVNVWILRNEEFAQASCMLSLLKPAAVLSPSFLKATNVISSLAAGGCTPIMSSRVFHKTANVLTLLVTHHLMKHMVAHILSSVAENVLGHFAHVSLVKSGYVC